MPPVPAHPGHNPARPDLVERDEALGLLVPAIQLASPDDAAIILVVGEIGMGKSDLLRTAFDAGEATGNAAFRARVTCHPSSPSYAPWVSLIEHGRMLDETIPAPLGKRTPAAPGPNVLIQQTARAILDGTESQAMALVFDDIQWADTSSLDLLLSIARQASGLPITIVMACETPLRDGQPIASFVPALLRDTPAHSIELEPLSGEGIRQILDSRFPDLSRSDQRAVRACPAVERRQPLYAVEMLEGIETGEDVEKALTTRRLDTLSFSLRHLAEYRLDQLSARARETIELASIIGDTFDLDLLDDVSELDTEALIRDLEEALDAGILVEEQNSRLRFRYGVVRQLLTETQSGLRRRASATAPCSKRFGNHAGRADRRSISPGTPKPPASLKRPLTPSSGPAMRPPVSSIWSTQLSSTGRHWSWRHRASAAKPARTCSGFSTPTALSGVTPRPRFGSMRESRPAHSSAKMPEHEGKPVNAMRRSSTKPAAGTTPGTFSTT
ncbi:MAG: AAA family ATPase [Thermomicrobiales bacterium]